jgi:GNAT superfamily N-acetyltransferase
MIQKISYEEIYPIWFEKLWPGRSSRIDPNSAMSFLGGYNIANMNTTPTFFGWVEDEKIVGVYSGHQCHDQGYRTRGLYVSPTYRRNGIGFKLVQAALEQARFEQCSYAWCTPRKDSKAVHERAGFRMVTDWEPSETGMNAYFYISLYTKDS